MKTKATLKQIAKELGVSVSTVSKALNDSPEISKPTKTKIQEYAKLKKYKPNIIGLNLKNQSTKTIGVIIPNILNAFFAKVFKGIEKVADEKGYNIITCISNESIEKEIAILEMLSNGTIDGFILSISEESERQNEYSQFRSIINEGIPIVMFDRIPDEVNCDKVIVDDYESACDAVKYLLKTGCNKIGFFTTINSLSIAKLRFAGYKNALEKNNIAVDEKLMIISDSQEEFDESVQNFFETQKVDAVFCIDEHSSVTAMKMILQKGYHVPNDISVIGFADGLWSRRMTPSLSTISQHAPEIGETAAKLLIERLESKEEKPFRTEIIKTELRKRDSVKKLN